MPRESRQAPASRDSTASRLLTWRRQLLPRVTQPHLVVFGTATHPSLVHGPLLSNRGTYKTVRTRFWPWFRVKVLKTDEVVPSSLGAARGGATVWARGCTGYGEGRPRRQLSTSTRGVVNLRGAVNVGVVDVASSTFVINFGGVVNFGCVVNFWSQ